MPDQYFAAHVSEKENIGRRRSRRSGSLAAAPQQAAAAAAAIAVELILPRAAKTIDGARLQWEGTVDLS